MQTSPLASISEYNSSESLLSYAPQSPTPELHIQFGTTEHVKPILVRPLKLDNDQVSDESLSLPLSPNSPKIIIDTFPRPLQIKVEEFEEIHSECEAEAKIKDDLDHAAAVFDKFKDTVKEAEQQLAREIGDITSVAAEFGPFNEATVQAAFTKDGQTLNREALNFCAHFLRGDYTGATHVLNNTITTKEQETASPPKNPQVSRASHVHQHLQRLHKIVTPITNNQHNDDDDNDDSDSTHLSGWDSNDDEEYNHLWPSPPKTPIEGDDMHSLQIHVCGPHPGQGWDINSIGTKNYYRLLITDPSLGRNIVAPYVSYAINQSHPTISKIGRASCRERV